MVGAAVLPRGRRVYGVRDSKMLPEDRREALFDRVAGWCGAWAVGAATQVECDTLGMADAQRLAAQRAFGGPRAGARHGVDRREMGLCRHRQHGEDRAGRCSLPFDSRRIDAGQGDAMTAR